MTHRSRKTMRLAPSCDCCWCGLCASTELSYAFETSSKTPRRWDPRSRMLSQTRWRAYTRTTTTTTTTTTTLLSCPDDEYKLRSRARGMGTRGQSNLYLREQGELLYWALAINTISRQTFK